MASRKQVDLRVGSNDPEPVVQLLTRYELKYPEGVHSRPLVQVPNPDGLVLSCGQDEILVRVEQTAASVLEMASASINLPLHSVSIIGPPGTSTRPQQGPKKRTALVSLMRHSLIKRSSPAETINGMVGWKATQFTPLS